MLDSSIIRVHQHGMREKEIKKLQGIGKTRGGWGTKIHALVDGLGYPIDCKITEGQVHDCEIAITLLEGKESKYVIADKGYDTNRIREHLKATNREAVIPNNENRSLKYKYDKHIYKERFQVERLFQKLKEWRRIATRYEKSLIMYQGMVAIGCLLLWIMF
jgi:transposase